MPRDSCDVCCQPGQLARNQDSYRAAHLQILCNILDNLNPGGTGVRFDWESLCDPSTGDPVFVQFQYNTDGTGLTLTGIYPDGTPYAGDLADLISCAGGGAASNVLVTNGAGAAAVNIQDGGNTITVDGTVGVTQVTSPWVISGAITTDIVQYAESSVHVSGQLGFQNLGVVNANGTSLASEGQYVPFGLDNRGRMQLSGVGNGGLVVLEDDAGGTGFGGILSMAFRNDTGAVLTSLDNDWSYISVDSRGRPLTLIHAVNTGSAFQIGFHAEDALHVSGDAGVMAFAVQKATPADISGEGDYTPLQISAGRLWTSSVITGTVAVTQSTSPWVVSGTVTATTPFPAAAPLTDNFATPTTTVVGAFGMVYDGATWDFMRGTAADGVLVNLGANNDVTVTGNVAVTQVTSPWVVSGTVAATQSGTWVLGANSGVDIGDVTVNNAAGAAAVNIQDGGNTITVDGTVGVTQVTSPWVVSGTVTATTPFPSAVLLTDDFATPTTTVVGSFGMVYDGATWDFMRGTAADGVLCNTEMPAAAALADATANPTTPLLGSASEIFNGTTWDRARSIVNGMNTTGTGVASAGLMGQLDDTGTSAVTENQFAPVRISTRRAILVEGVASGTAQPISGSLTTVTTVTTVTNITNQGQLVDNAAFVDGTTRLNMAGYIFDEVAGTALTENDAAAARVDSKRAQVFVLEDATTRGRRQTVTAAGGAYVEQPTAANLNAQVTGDVAHDAADAGNPIKIGGRAQTDGTTAPSAVSATNDRVNAFFDTQGFQHVKDHSQEDVGTILTAINTTYDDTTTTAASADITCTGYRWVDFFFTLDSTNTPTDITLTAQLEDGGNYFDYREGYWGKFIFDDVSVATAQNIWVRFPAPASGTFRINVVATGTDATNTFDITNAKVFLRT